MTADETRLQGAIEALLGTVEALQALCYALVKHEALTQEEIREAMAYAMEVQRQHKSAHPADRALAAATIFNSLAIPAPLAGKPRFSVIEGGALGEGCSDPAERPSDGADGLGKRGRGATAEPPQRGTT